MLENVSKFWNDVGGQQLLQSNMPSIVDNFKTRNYSEQSKLLHDGKLGASGYIISNAIDGMIKCHLESEQTKRAAQTAITGIIEKSLASEQGLLDHIKAIQQADHNLIVSLKDNLFTQVSPLINAQAELIQKHDTFLLELKKEEEDVKKHSQDSDVEINKICESTMTEAIQLKRLEMVEKRIKTLQDRVDNKRRERHELMLQFSKTLEKEIEQSHLTKRQFIEELGKKSERDHQFAMYFEQVHGNIVTGCQSLMSDIMKQNTGVVDKLGDIVVTMVNHVANKKLSVKNKNKKGNTNDPRVEEITDDTEKTTLTPKPTAAIEHKKAAADLMDAFNKQKSQAPSSVASNNAFFPQAKDNAGANNKLPVAEAVQQAATPAAKQPTNSI